jgi:formylglycine-generating enzyme required for sulfatase activity
MLCCTHRRVPRQSGRLVCTLIRSARGGCWNDGSAIIRAATRNWAPPDYAPQPLKNYRSAGFGLRVVQVLDGSAGIRRPESE